jgi:hypothetical protein
MSAETIVNMAKVAWDIIKDGAPSAELTNSTANAVPQVDDWQSLTNATGPRWIQRRRAIEYLWPFDDYLHADLVVRLSALEGLAYRGCKIWYDQTPRLYPFGYPYRFVANQLHQYILIFQKA